MFTEIQKKLLLAWLEIIVQILKVAGQFVVWKMFSNFLRLLLLILTRSKLMMELALNIYMCVFFFKCQRPAEIKRFLTKENNKEKRQALILI